MKHFKHRSSIAAAALLLAFAAPAFAEEGWFRAETILHPSVGVTLVIESSGPPFNENDVFLSACHEVRAAADADFFTAEIVIRCRHLLLGGEANDRIETFTLAPLNEPPITFLLLGTGIFDGLTGKCEHDPTYRIGLLFRCEWSR